MGITNSQIKNEVWNAASSTWSADIYWDTDMDASTELSYGEVPSSGSCSMTTMPGIGSDCTAHTYPVTGLKESATYRFLVKSFDGGAGMDMPCDDGKSPFDHIMDAAPVSSSSGAATVSSSPASGSRALKLGDSVNINVSAKDSSGAGVPGQAVTASILNTPAHGTLAPSKTVTDVSGNAVIAFTGTSRGTAVMGVQCGAAGCKEKIWVCKTWLDYLLAILRIPF